MAFVTKEIKQSLFPAIKKYCKEQGFGGISLSIKDYQCLVLTIKEGTLDMVGNWLKNADVSYNRTYIEVTSDYNFSGKEKEVVAKLLALMKTPDYTSESDPMHDYSECTYHIKIRFGNIDTNYVHKG